MGASNALPLSITNPLPTITSLYQTSVASGTSSLVFFVKGTGFVAGASQIVFGTTALPATLNSSGFWVATIPGSELATARTVPVSLRNPAPGGGTSASLPFAVK
jgi:hypothetical protein